MGRGAQQILSTTAAHAPGSGAQHRHAVAAGLVIAGRMICV
jgi:hypothetical protein